MKKEYKGKWFNFYTGWSGFSIIYELAGYFDPRPQLQLYIIWGKLFLYFPWQHLHPNPYPSEEEKLNMERKKKLDGIVGKKSEDYIKKVPYDECDPPRYGVYYYERSICFPHGMKTYFLHLPWELDWIRTSYLKKDGEWVHETLKDRNKNFWDKDKWKDILHYETHPYTYTTDTGEIKHSDATISLVEREWRWRWFKWFKWFKWIRRIDKSIDIEFSSPVGEHKGGTTGCSYTILPKETPYECLKRMEKERKFR